jgi:hypothetical protein
MADNLAESRYFHAFFRDLLHIANLRHGTDGFTSPPKDFFALKNPTASAGFEPANLDTKGQHAISRPPKPLELAFTYFLVSCNMLFPNTESYRLNT